MAQAPGEQNPQDRSCPRYLPYLTWTMLGLLFTWFVVWFFFYRPTEAEELRLASYHQALRYVEATYIYDVEQEGLHDAAMGGMMRSLPDKYSVYVDKRGRRRLEQRTEGQFGGIGVLVTARDGAAVIVEVTAGGPAEEAGVEAGDIITGVDGEDVTELSLDEVVDRIRGEIGADVTIGLRRPATEGRLTVTIERERVVVPNIIWRALEDGIVHLEFRSFDRDCPSEMEDALEQITEEGVRGLILDVRNNAGGLMPAAVKISDMFLSGGLIM
ncbi:MAG: PDZ domain-containing protein, partial [Candidatus Brocadiia bacterium]